MNIGLYIKQLRMNKGSTLHEVAVGTNIDSTLLSKIERGDRLPTDIQISKLSVFFQIPVKNLQTISIAEKIIKDFGLNETTIDALQLVQEEFITYKSNKNE